MNHNNFADCFVIYYEQKQVEDTFAMHVFLAGSVFIYLALSWSLSYIRVIWEM